MPPLSSKLFTFPIRLFMGFVNCLFYFFGGFFFLQAIIPPSSLKDTPLSYQASVG